MSKHFFVCLGFLLLIGCEGADKAVTDSSGHFVLAARMPEEQQAMLQRDLDRLHTIDVAASQRQNPYLRKAMQISEVSARELFSWLSARVRFVVGEKFKLDASNLVEIGPYPGKVNSEFSGSMPFDPRDPLQNAKDLKVRAMNLGSAVYITGKEYGLIAGVRIPGWDSVVPIRSPRAGVIQIGEALFGDYAGPDLNSEANSLMRAATFLHEARHSDGNGASLGFMHMKCPKGHQFEGANACDDNDNGPYAIQSRLMHVFRESCQTCSVRESTILALYEADQLYRVTCSKRSQKTAKEKVREMCRTLLELYEQLGTPPAEECLQQELELNSPDVCWWDASPESV